MDDIKIFVSHRIDMRSELIDNPLYIPVRCGAIFDKENLMGIAGDDTGDNISEKREAYGELTVQYWAWKNAQADYYGLCHYRRYLSFAPERIKTDKKGLAPVFCIDNKSLTRLHLLDSAHMAEEIRRYDLIIPEPISLEGYPTPKGAVRTIRELWEAYDGIMISKEAIDLMFSLIDELAPEYSASARAYFKTDGHRGYNCFVMRRELFDRLCAFQFPILFALEERLQDRAYLKELPRIPGYIGEMLFGIFTFHLVQHEHWRVKELQILYFLNTQPIRSNWDRIRMYMSYGARAAFGAVKDFVLPIGTRRRRWVRDIWHRYIIRR